jgi:hypothetical protein
MIQPLGKIAPTSAGTPVSVQASFPQQKPQSIHGIMFEAAPGNTGKVYIGWQTLDRSTFAGVMAILAVPTTNFLPTFSAAVTIAPNGLNVNEFWIDADNSNEGAIVTLLIT